MFQPQTKTLTATMKFNVVFIQNDITVTDWPRSLCAKVAL